ncbi:MAG TPA: VWA domain-containing protein [Firmicutes bacterium]|nr:VWA domain-containing protein [Bacillota bacterium]
MKQGLVELVFILDKSGSMSGLESDTIGGYNSMLAKQKQVEGECVVTTVLFDHGYELLHDRIDIKAVQAITEDDYQVGGSTALLDAMGRTINKIATAQKNTSEEYRAEKVMCVIITDGEENSSREFSLEKVKQLVEQHKEKANWEFVFLGANMDAIQTAGYFGISSDRAQSFHADKEGVALNFAVMSESVAEFRRSGKVADNWKERIESDFKRRGGK